MSVPQNLLIRYTGWSVARLPTDPDPTDEPHGASGYTYAFAGEPRLDRIFRLQPEPPYRRPGPGYPAGRWPWGELQQGEWPWGTFVRDAEILHDDGSLTAVPALVGATVDMLHEPKLEDRNWLLAYPGWEPFVPYRLQIMGEGVHIERDNPLDPDDPTGEVPYWKLPTPTLMATGAKGVNFEHETVGTATGIWDAVALYREREAWLEIEIGKTTNPQARQALQSRLYEVRKGITNADSDNRIQAHYAVERFDFPMTGLRDTVTKLDVPGVPENARLDQDSPWFTSFFFACFDADLLGAYIQGSLEIPFKRG